MRTLLSGSCSTTGAIRPLDQTSCRLGPMRLYVIARHGESTLNHERRINGDPSVPVALTAKGRDEARLLGKQIAHIPVEVCVHSRFPRTRETAEIALAGRDVSFETEPLLDDIDIGELEGQTLDDYRAWKDLHTRDDAFPGGESLNDAARRYASRSPRRTTSTRRRSGGRGLRARGYPKALKKGPPGADLFTDPHAGMP